MNFCSVVGYNNNQTHLSDLGTNNDLFGHSLKQMFKPSACLGFYRKITSQYK